MIKTYKYGLRPPISGEVEVRHQLELAYHYQVQLLKAKITARATRRTLECGAEINQLKETLKAKQDALEELVAQLKRQRKATRSRSETQELRDAIKAARTEQKEARVALTAKRHEISKDLKPAREEIHDRWLETRRATRAEFGASGKKLYSGTYILIESSVDQADSMTKLWDGLEPTDPHFPRNGREGRVGAQIQHGISVPELFRCQDTRVQLRTEPDMFQEVVGRNGKSRGGGKRRPQFGVLKLRVASDERKPLWAEWPIKMHRPLPKDARIKYVTVSCHKTGPREVWEALFSVDTSEQQEYCGTGTVAIDIGWRVIGDEVRVATWYDSQGNAGELRLPAPLVSALWYPDELGRIRTNNLNAMKQTLLASLPEDLPEWLRRRTVRKDERLPSSKQAHHYLSQWKSFSRWAVLAKYWEGGECPEVLEKWRYHDFHLWEWQENQRRQALNRRKDHYRVFAAWLARTYGCVILEDFELPRVAKKANPEANAENETARANRQKVAVHEMRDAIVNAMVSRGGDVWWENPAFTTQECPVCHHIEKWNAAASILRKPVCPKCKETWDQDYSAAEILLGRGMKRNNERPGGDDVPRGTRRDKNEKKTESKWERVKKQLDEKQARREGARAQQIKDTESLGI